MSDRKVIYCLHLCKICYTQVNTIAPTPDVIDKNPNSEYKSFSNELDILLNQL